MVTTLLTRPPARPPRRGGIPARLAGPTPLWRSQPALKVLIIIAAAGDLANFYITVSLAFDAPAAVNIILVAAVTAVSLGLAHAVGAAWRDHREGAPTRLGGAVRTTMLIFWVFIGLGACYVRAITPAPSASTATQQQFGTGAAPDNFADTNSAHWAAAVFLLVVYLASGAVAAWHAYIDHGPQLAAQRHAWRRLNRAGVDHRHAQDLVEHNTAMLRQSIDEGYRLERNFRAALANRAGLANECKELVRVRFAESQADPGTTNLLTSRSPSTEEGRQNPT